MDMRIAGGGNIPSGEYDNIKISGSATLYGYVKCSAFSCAGSSKGEGLDCIGEMRISGNSHFSEGIRAGELRVAGSLDSKGSVKADKRITVAGSVKAGGDIEAEELKVDGKVDCKGLINAENVNIKIDGEMKIGSIGGSKIAIIMKSSKKACAKLPLFGKLAERINGSVSVEGAIEGDDIALEATRTPRVTGRTVAIGRGCEIGLVQYGENVEIDPDARVERTERI